MLVFIGKLIYSSSIFIEQLLAVQSSSAGSYMIGVEINLLVVVVVQILLEEWNISILLEASQNATVR